LGDGIVSLDLRTIAFFSALLALAQLIVPFFFTRLATPYRGIPYWVAGTTCSVIGFLLAAGRGIVPDFFSIVVANTLHVMTGCFIYSSCRLFVERPLPRRWLYGAPLVTALFMAYFTFVDNSMTVRSLYYSFIVGSLLIHCALELRHVPDPRLRFSYWFTTGVFAIYGFFLVAVRIPLLLIYPLQEMFDPHPAQLVMMIVSVMGGVLWTMGFAFIVTQRVVLELHRTATHDFLTETLNRRAAQSHINEAIEQAPYLETPLSILLLDIDHFKQVNDRFGHEVGDKVLVALAGLLHRHVRGNDMVARWGGEEFLILLKNTNAPTALAVAERLIRIIAATPIMVGNAAIVCNVSIGIATTTPHHADGAALIRAADNALYHAKRNGRNRVVAYQTDMAEIIELREESLVMATPL
jgi:diguanylate cyclase (GGDEF)-like protein